MSSFLLVLASFLASAVEMVEALTIVLAVGVTYGWRSALTGVAAALVALGVSVAALGPALVQIPIETLRLVIGALLLVFGLQWLRTAILRASGYTALHDERTAYLHALEAARAAGRELRTGVDWYAFTLSFKGVSLEGLEVAFIVLTFGSAQGSISLAALGAGAAVVLVALAGLLVSKPLTSVPENTLKFSVGTLLTTFGIFWGGEGAGVAWPGGEGAILAVLALVLIASLALTSWMRHERRRTAATALAVRSAGP